MFEEKRRPDGRPWSDARAVLNGVLWVLLTGAPWHDLPGRYPPVADPAIGGSSGGGRTASSATEGFIDASFNAAEKGGSVICLQRAAKANKIMAIVDRRSLALAVDVACFTT